MRKMSLISAALVAALALAAGIGLHLGGAAAQGNGEKNPPATPPVPERRQVKVAVVNVSKTYISSDIWQKFKMEIAGQMKIDFDDNMEPLLKELKDRQEAYASARRELSTPPIVFETINREIDDLEKKLEIWKSARKEAGTMLGRRYHALALAAALVVIERVAKEDGYDLVLRRVDLDMSEQERTDVAGIETDVFTASMMQAQVLYHNQAGGVVQDITKLVAERLQKIQWSDIEKDAKAKMGG